VALLDARRVTSSAELLGGLEVGLLVAHLISPPGLAAPASVSVLEALDGRAVSAQRVDSEDRRPVAADAAPTAMGWACRTVEHETHVEYQSLLKDLVLESEYLGLSH
jgi:hypothetical protein